MSNQPSFEATGLALWRVTTIVEKYYLIEKDGNN